VSPIFICFAALLVVAQFALPRKLAFLPLIIAAFHVGNVELFSNLTTARLVILCGIVRAIAFGDFRFSFRNKIDVMFIVFAFLAILSIPAHKSEYVNPTTERLGLIFNVFGSYLYGRAFIPDFAALGRFSMCLAFVLMPLAAAMAVEQTTGRNAYVVLGSKSSVAVEREGRKRAAGPFSHSILAGTAGATSFPFMIILWRQRQRALAVVGIGACMVTAVASASSAPLAALGIATVALFLWPFREHVRKFQVLVILALLALHMTMEKPVWYLMAKMDLAGGSTGRHRAVLIDSAITNFHDWWLAGTDYTRNWTQFGVSWSPDHADITNYYLRMAVIGGLPLMLTFIAIILVTFRYLGKRMLLLREYGSANEFLLWCVGCTLFAHSINILSISYFDQMYAVLFLLIGMASSLSTNDMEEEDGLSVESPEPDLPPMPNPFSKTFYTIQGPLTER
jgi:hypothetical protein